MVGGDPAPARYWPARLSKRTVALHKLAATAKARWRVAQDDRELEADLGLGHSAGRSWPSLHHHVALLVTAAFVFLRQEQRR